MAVTPMESEAFPSGLAGESGAPGMVRIRRGEQVRWIWPVHLPGWMALGWQVATKGQSPGGSSGAEVAPTAAFEAPLPVVLTEDPSLHEPGRTEADIPEVSLHEASLPEASAAEPRAKEPAPAKPRHSKRRPEPKPQPTELQGSETQGAETQGAETPEAAPAPSPADDLLADVLP